MVDHVGTDCKKVEVVGGYDPSKAFSGKKETKGSTMALSGTETILSGTACLGRDRPAVLPPEFSWEKLAVVLAKEVRPAKGSEAATRPHGVSEVPPSNRQPTT